MNTAFQQVIGAKDDERLELFLASARHYFDVFRLLQSPLGERAIQDRALGADCARHARMFLQQPRLRSRPGGGRHVHAGAST